MVKYLSNSINSAFGALADPTRRAIIERLSANDCSVLELAKPFDVSLPAISKHLRVLEHAGLLIQIKDGRIRRCRLKVKPMKDISDWVNRYHKFWKVQLDSLEDHLKNSKDRM